jgi:hypothetical protein
VTLLEIYAHDKQLETSCRKMSKLTRRVSEPTYGVLTVSADTAGIKMARTMKGFMAG